MARMQNNVQIKSFFPYLCEILYLLNLTSPSPQEISHSVFWTACPVTSKRGDFTPAIQFTSDESLNRTVKARSRSYSSISEKTNTACQCHLRAQYHTGSLQKPCTANWFVPLSGCLHSTGQPGRAPSQGNQRSYRNPAAALWKTPPAPAAMENKPQGQELVRNLKQLLILRWASP